MEKTANLKLNLPAQGTADWNVPLNENFTILDKEYSMHCSLWGGSILEQ